MPVKVNVKTRIIVNGREYSSPDEMPEEVRQKYETALARGSQPTARTVKTSSKITFNGQPFNSPDEMPAGVRRIYDSVMASAAQLTDGTPDSPSSSSQDLPVASTPALIRPGPVIAPARLDRRWLVAGAAAILAFLLLGGLILMTLMRGV